MDKVKIVHTADIHLGSPFTNIPYDEALIRQNEALQTAIKIINNASEADAVLLSGDIFDTADISRSAVDIFLSAIKGLKNTCFFYSCGNHDSYYSPAVSYCRSNAPDNLHIFPPDKLSFVTLEDKKLRIYGCSFSSEHTKESMLENIELCDSDYINILCAHSDLNSDIYNPCNPEYLSSRGFNYIALGHIHSFSGIKKLGNSFYAYPGIPEPRGFDECGKKGYIAGTVSKQGCELDFYNTQRRRYIDETIDISDFNNEFEITELLDHMAESEDNICRFTLLGENHFSSAVNTRFIEGQVKAFYCTCIDKSVPGVSVSDYVSVSGLKGICAQKTLDKLEKESLPSEKAKIKKAFSILLEAFENR